MTTIESLKRNHGPLGKNSYTGYRIPPVEHDLRQRVLNAKGSPSTATEELEEALEDYGYTSARMNARNLAQKGTKIYHRNSEPNEPTYYSAHVLVVNNEAQLPDALHPDPADYQPLNLRVADNTDEFTDALTDSEHIPYIAHDDGGSSVLDGVVPIDTPECRERLEITLPATFLCTIKVSESYRGEKLDAVYPMIPTLGDVNIATCSCGANIYNNILSASDNDMFFLCKHEFFTLLAKGDSKSEYNYRFVTDPEYVQMIEA